MCCMQRTLSKLKHEVLNFSSIYLPNSISGPVEMFLQAFAFLFEIYWLVWKILLILYSYFLLGLSHQPMACMASALPIEPSRYINLDVLYAKHSFKIKAWSLKFFFNLFTRLNLWSSWNVSSSFCILIWDLLISLKNSLQPVLLLPQGFEPSTYALSIKLSMYINFYVLYARNCFKIKA